MKSANSNMLVLKAKEGSQFYSIIQVASMTGRSPFLMVFRKNYGVPIVIHECWHLFFGSMTDIDDSDDIRFRDINKEVYAYDFGDLYSTVFEALREMKAKEMALRS